jgi:hypothetical protein
VESGLGRITIVTEAFERPRGTLNSLGFSALGARAQQLVWDTYLRNIDARHFGGRGKPQEFVSVPVPATVNPLVGYVTP